MKKQFLLVGAIAAFGLTAFLVSCSKDDDKKGVPANGCTCDLLSDKGAILDTENYSASQLSAYSSCDDYASFMMKSLGANSSGYSYNCRARN